MGFTISSTSLVVFAELYWVPGIILQAEDRVHRMGQTAAVDVHYLIMRGTVDERMFQAVERRARDAARTMSGKVSTFEQAGILNAQEVPAKFALNDAVLRHAKR